MFLTTRSAACSAWRGSDLPDHWHEQATDSAVRFLKEDPDGLGRVFAAADLLADEPRPEASVALGSPDLRRLDAGPYRLIYQVEAASGTIVVLHIGRIPRAD